MQCRKLRVSKLFILEVSQCEDASLSDRYLQRPRLWRREETSLWFFGCCGKKNGVGLIEALSEPPQGTLHRLHCPFDEPLPLFQVMMKMVDCPFDEPLPLFQVMMKMVDYPNLDADVDGAMKNADKAVV